MDILKEMDVVKEIITEIRKYRQDNNIKKHEKVDITIMQNNNGIIPKYESVIRKLGNVEDIKVIYLKDRENQII